MTSLCYFVGGSKLQHLSHIPELIWASASTINHNSEALRVCGRACVQEIEQQMKTQQIELFVITVYPNTGMPAIILPTVGMAGGKWDSSLCSVILFFSFFFLPLPILYCFSDGMGIIFLCAFMEVTEGRGEKMGR